MLRSTADPLLLVVSMKRRLVSSGVRSRSVCVEGAKPLLRA
jgi:hypothetical protein